ncbi:MAG: hypothetical protein JSS83_09195 [Cyanobacteria bacterium SZAS LIN-3]|nr:hypothetical protein [Cyanobacteria bacterium SZAS LIN-3]
MSLGLYLKGQFAQDSAGGPLGTRVFDRATLEEFEKWLSNVAFDELEWTQWTEDDEGNPCLMMQLHPGAEPMMLSNCEDGALLLAAATSSAGPGYHIFICDLIRKMGQVHGLQWITDDEVEFYDETGYFETGDKQRLYDEFSTWIGALTARVQELSRDGAKFHLAMPFDGHQFDVPEPILTQLGPRTMDWLEAVSHEPILGQDIFPWWEDGHGAEYHLGRAVCYMWNAVRWRDPLTENEAELLEAVLRHLDSAYNLDPDLNYPWPEWSEILQYLGSHYEHEDLVREMAHKAEDTEHVPVGYRRRDVRKNLGGGWSVVIPGDFVEELEEGQTFLAFDETRNVRVTCMSASDTAGNSLSATEILKKIKVFDDPLKYEQGAVIGRAYFEAVTEPESAFWMLRGVTAANGTFTQVTVCFESEEQRQWAIDTWRSLDHRSSHWPRDKEKKEAGG